MSYEVKITLKKPYADKYAFLPSDDVVFENFADAILRGEADKLLHIKVRKLKK